MRPGALREGAYGRGHQSREGRCRASGQAAAARYVGGAFLSALRNEREWGRRRGPRRRARGRAVGAGARHGSSLGGRSEWTAGCSLFTKPRQSLGPGMAVHKATGLAGVVVLGAVGRAPPWAAWARLHVAARK
jgi:hypothetical protein